MKNLFPTLIFVIALTFGIVLIYVMQKGRLRQEKERQLQKQYEVVGSLDFREIRTLPRKEIAPYKS